VLGPKIALEAPPASTRVAERAKDVSLEAADRMGRREDIVAKLAWIDYGPVRVW
jgi:hypothetical protein